MASGCTGCDGKSVYATITRFIESVHWYDDAQELIAEDGDFTLAAAGTKKLVIYATYANGAPKLVDNAELAFVSGTPATATVAADGTVTAVAVGTSVITFTYPASGTAILTGSVTVTVA